MDYISVAWLHNNSSDPVRLVSELDDERFERRKLEFFTDQTVGAASGDFEAAGTRLGVAAVPTLSEINEDPQFEAIEITPAEFEGLWQKYARPEPR